jgi:hypothetical protein
MKYIITCICLLSLIITPCSSINYNKDDLLKITAAVLSGGAAGYLGSYLTSHPKHGKKGKEGKAGQPGVQGIQGPQGEKGESPFIVDKGSSVRFHFFLYLPENPPVDTFAIPFVSRPDGSIVYGDTLDIENESQCSLGDLLIEDPIFGTYHAGVHFISNNEFKPQSIELIINAVIIRDNNTETTTLYEIQSIQFDSIDKFQITTDFTYVSQIT